MFTVPPLYFRQSPCSFKPDTDVRETEQKRDLWHPQISSLTGVQGCTPVNSLFSKGLRKCICKKRTASVIRR